MWIRIRIHLGPWIIEIILGFYWPESGFGSVFIKFCGSAYGDVATRSTFDLRGPVELTTYRIRKIRAEIDKLPSLIG